MPIYEYRCLGCSALVEKMQKVSDEPLKTCEDCGAAMEKQWSLSGFQLKGAGWYVTDYAAKKGAAADKSDKTEKTDKGEKPDKSEKSEKTSAAESTAKAETASNKSNDTTPATVSKTETAAKKD